MSVSQMKDYQKIASTPPPTILQILQIQKAKTQACRKEMVTTTSLMACFRRGYHSAAMSSPVAASSAGWVCGLWCSEPHPWISAREKSVCK